MLLIFNFIMIIILSKIFLVLGKCISDSKYPIHLNIGIIYIEQKQYSKTYILFIPFKVIERCKMINPIEGNLL